MKLLKAGLAVLALAAGTAAFAFHCPMDMKKIDDALACFPVHGACGIWGALATGLFGAKVLGGHPVYGLETADWLSQIGVQALGAFSIMLFTAAAGFALFFVLKKFNLLRVLKDAELYGIDIAMHKTYAYPEDMIENQFQ